MKKKCFLMGILGLVFVLAFTGCPNDAGGNDGGNNNGGGDNPLLGTWVNDPDLAQLSTAVIFTDYRVNGVGITDGTKLAYYATGLGGGSGTDYTVTGSTYTLPIGYGYTMDVSNLSSGTFTLTNYILGNDQVNPVVPPKNVTFTRATGTSGTDLRGIWVSSNLTAAETAQYYTIVLIGGDNNKKVWSAVGQNSCGEANYLASDVNGTTYISWNGAAIQSYTKRTNASNVTTLSIGLPGGGQNVALRPLETTPTF
jgi:hypothetical protein